MTEGKFANAAGKIIGLIMLGIILYWIYSEVISSKGNEENGVSYVDSVLDQMSLQHDAIPYSGLINGITRKGGLKENILSVDLEILLDSLKSGPISAELYLIDLKQIDTGFIGIFSTTHRDFIYFGEFYQYFELAMDPIMTNFILENYKNDWSECFAAVATLESFERSKYFFYAPNYDEPQSHIEIELSAPGAIIFRGKMVAVEFLEDCY